MSFLFTISPAKNVRFSAIDNALRAEFGDILTWEATPPNPWPPNFYAHVYLWGISTRSVALSLTKDDFHVRILACSCAEDHELALRTIEIVAEMTGGVIESEQGESMTVETLRQVFDPARVDGMVEAGAIILPNVLAHDPTQGPLTIPGPVRDFVIGPRVMEELQGPKESFPERLFRKMREVRYFDDEEYFQATPMEMQPDGESRISFAVWGEGVTYLLPNVKFLAVAAEPVIFVPLEAVWELAGDACRALDDAQVLVEAIDGEDWAALVEHAKLLAVVP